MKWLFVLFFVWHYQIFETSEVGPRMDQIRFSKYLKKSDHCRLSTVKDYGDGLIIVGYLQDDGLKDLYDDVIDKTMTMPWSRDRKTFLEYVRHDREMSRLARQARQKAEREAIYSEFRPRTWADFLRHKAAEGHQEAIRVLRKRQRAPQQPDLQVAPENHHPEVEKDRDSAEASR